MIILGHSLIPYTPFYRIAAQEALSRTPSNAIVLFEFDAPLARYCFAQNVPFALNVKNIQELMLGHALHASYFVVGKALVLQAQKIADDYLFDAKILLASSDDNDIEFAALHGIDGILFADGIRE